MVVLQGTATNRGMNFFGAAKKNRKKIFSTRPEKWEQISGRCRVRACEEKGAKSDLAVQKIRTCWNATLFSLRIIF